MCGWTDDDCGLGRMHWVNMPDDGENFRATVGLDDRRNVLRFGGSAAMDEQFADAGAEAARRLPAGSFAELPDIDVIVAAPARAGYRAALAARLGVPGSGSSSPTTRGCIPPLWWPRCATESTSSHRAAVFCSSPRARASLPVPRCTALRAPGARTTAGATCLLPEATSGRDHRP